MSFNTNGALLEAIRVGAGNNSFSFPPRSYVSNTTTFNDITSRAEYAILVSGNPALDTRWPTVLGFDIADPSMSFRWTKNQSTVVRFDYDGYNRRWLPSPGGPPDALGIIQNSNRLSVIVPDLTITNAPFSIYVDNSTRFNFTPQLVSDSSVFTNPNTLTHGVVEISQSDGKLNFSTFDISRFNGQTIFSTRQSYFDRTKAKGVIGALPPALTSYYLYLNPKPATGQVPRIRIGYQTYLNPIEVATESAFGTVASGQVQWALDTGRILLSTIDVENNFNENIYYDGVTIGSFSLNRVMKGLISSNFPTVSFSDPSLIGVTDPVRYIVFAEKSGVPRQYFSTVIITSTPTSQPSSGSAYILSTTGEVYLNDGDISSFYGYNFGFVDTVAQVENGVAVQFYRSGVNTSGPAVVPDFTSQYIVTDQLIQDGIQSTPFILLPTQPLVDSNLTYNITAGSGSSGTFTGQLNDAKDPTKLGAGYALDLDKHQLKFTNRKTSNITLAAASPVVKMDDAVVLSSGFEVTKNSTPIAPGVDFIFNADTGFIEFTESVGTYTDTKVTGTVSLPNVFVADSHTFDISDVGSGFLINSGSNIGFYTVISVSPLHQISVSPNFIAAQTETGDVIVGAEVIADRFWSDFTPPFKKFTLSVGTSPSGPYSLVANTEYSVLATTGQVNLKTPALPGASYQISYIWQQSLDNGVTVTPTSVTEKALFKVRQEAATTTSGSSTVTFNSAGHTVNTARPIEVYVDGVSVPSTNYTFISPGTLELPVKITTETVIVNYWVEDATGGETSFDLINSPIDVDFPQVRIGDSQTTFNGNQTGLIFTNSALQYISTSGGVYVLIASASSYDSVNDTTQVTFFKPAPADSLGSFRVTGPITSLVQETNNVDVLAQNTNVLSIFGSQPYKAGMIVFINSDPYSVSSVEYNSQTNRTRLTLAASAIKNYIIPVVIHTVRPILTASSSFQTDKSAHLGFQFTLIHIGTQRSILRKNVDYTVADGGSVKLSSSISYGDELIAIYTARQYQPAGTQLTLNYSYAVNPSSVGIAGQKLLSSYHLYGPDSFFYRVETYTSFQPEVVDLLQQSAQTGGVSGPNTSSAKSLKTKDYGAPSPWFNEQHLANLDAEIQRILKFYNDLINQYEDILANIDGRVVGSTSGKFRYDGNLNNAARTTYSSVTNDIDDKIKLYDQLVVSSVFPLTFQTVPVYSYMFEPNSLSRIFPTFNNVITAFNDKVTSADFGQPIGSLKISNLTTVGQLSTSAAVAVFSTVVGYGGSRITVSMNGSTDPLVPAFTSGQPVSLYDNNGKFEINATISAINSNGSFTLSHPVTSTTGCILQQVSDPTVNHFYTPGRDVGINSDSGQILNMTFTGSLHSLQAPVAGSEIMDCPVTFTNTDTMPRRVPVLDGKELTDDGRRVARNAPILKHTNEINLLDLEKQSISNLNFAKVQVDLVTCYDPTFLPPVGSRIKFINGVNANNIRTVISTTSSPTVTFVLDSSLPDVDTAGHDFTVIPNTPFQTTSDIVNQELAVLLSNTSGAPPSGALLLSIDSELKSAFNAALGLGSNIVSSGTITTSTTLNDSLVDFISSGVVAGCYIVISSGTAAGLYKVVTVTSHSITIDSTFPYYVFPVTGVLVNYTTIIPWPFVNAKEFDFLAPFIQSTLTFFNSTSTWASAITYAGITARTTDINNRKTALTQYIQNITNLLTSGDKLYDTRYAWIQQRTDRKNGLLVQKTQAIAKRMEDLVNLVLNQQKLLVASTLV